MGLPGHGIEEDRLAQATVETFTSSRDGRVLWEEVERNPCQSARSEYRNLRVKPILP